MQILYWTGFALQLVAFALAVVDLRQRKLLLEEYNTWTTPVTSEKVTGWATMTNVPWSLLGRQRRETEERIRRAELKAELAIKQVAFDLKNTTDVMQQVSEHQTETLRQVLAVDWQAIVAVVLGLLGFILGAIGGAPD